MSTKIYDAYRIKKSDINNIYDTLRSFKKFAIDDIANDEETLKAIHLICFVYGVDKVQENEDKLKEFIDNYNKGGYRLDWEIYPALREAENMEHHKSIVPDLSVTPSIFEDEEYWYLKFFCNSRWSSHLLRKMEKEFDFLEDYHYQNQSDPPEDIPYEEYKKRDEKWDELTKHTGGNYRDGLMYIIFDAYEFRELLQRNYYYKEKEDWYEHLAYKFDKPMKLKE